MSCLWSTLHNTRKIHLMDWDIMNRLAKKLAYLYSSTYSETRQWTVVVQCYWKMLLQHLAWSCWKVQFASLDTHYVLLFLQRKSNLTSVYLTFTSGGPLSRPMFFSWRTSYPILCPFKWLWQKIWLCSIFFFFCLHMYECRKIQSKIVITVSATLYHLQLTESV